MTIVKSDKVFIVEKNKIVSSVCCVKSVSDNETATVATGDGRTFTLSQAMLITDDEAAKLLRSIPQCRMPYAQYTHTKEGWTISV